MPEIIFDCCCLSNFALSNSLVVLKRLYEKSIHISQFVSAEVIRGIQQGHKELGKIQDFQKKGWIKELVLTTQEEKALYEKLSVSLGAGEASSIALAKTRKYVLACDDKAARREAGLVDVKLTGTIGILKRAIQNDIIHTKKGNLILERMRAKGFYSPQKYLD